MPVPCRAQPTQAIPRRIAVRYPKNPMLDNRHTQLTSHWPICHACECAAICSSGFAIFE